jgi:hypothetical protein
MTYGRQGNSIDVLAPKEVVQAYNSNSYYAGVAHCHKTGHPEQDVGRMESRRTADANYQSCRVGPIATQQET